MTELKKQREKIIDLLEIFGSFLLVLISLDLLEIIKRFYIEGRIELKVIVTVARIALGRTKPETQGR